MPAAQLRVLTLNLWGSGGDWPTRRTALASGLRQLAPDLVAFQECVRTAAYDQAADLLGDDFRFFQQRARSTDGTGITIASRWPLQRTAEVGLHVTPRTHANSETADFPCGALLTEVLVPEPIGPVVFVNHFPNWQVDFEHERQLQAVATARAIDDFIGGADVHVVVAGDLDADPEAASIRFWTGRQSIDGLSVCYRDAWESSHRGEPGDTFTPDNPLVAAPDWPFRRIDYILVRCGARGSPTLHIRHCQRAFDVPVDGVWASDHFGVVADLTASRTESPAATA